jgi:hypothetical protein
MGTLPVRVAVAAPRHASPDARRARLLRNIAVALTKDRFGRPAADVPAGAGADADPGPGGSADAWPT